MGVHPVWIAQMVFDHAVTMEKYTNYGGGSFQNDVCLEDEIFSDRGNV